MRSPIRTMAGNLMWTRTGKVWAMWRLAALPYGYRPARDKLETRTLHQALIRALPGESLLLGVCAETDPVAVVERMIDGVDLETHPDWAAECEATLDSLETFRIGERLHWLAVPLSGTSPVREAFESAAADLRDALGLARGPLPAKEIARRTEQARKVQAAIPGPFLPAPATPAQIVWLHQHAQQRGLQADLALPTPREGQVVEQLLTPRSGAALTEPLLDEGGQTDYLTTDGPRVRKSLRDWNPMARRFLKVIQAHAVTPAGAGAGGGDGDVPPGSYQALLALADLPADGMVFPGSEFLGRIDECGLDVDWAVRLEVRSSEEVAKKNRRALINLNDQYGQREGELGHGLNELERAAADLAEYAAIMSSDKLEVEVQATVIFAVSAPTAQDVVDDARALAAYFGAAGYRLAQPLGGQEDLWWGMTPGAPTNQTIRDFAQITTSASFAASIPLANNDLGDRKGSLTAINISSGRPSVVLHDIAGASHKDVSGSMGIAGELGAGKSALMKKLCGDVVDRGGQVVVPDRTAVGEWATWAAAVTEAIVVDVADPAVSLDPLRVHGPHIGARVTQSFLTQLLNVRPTEAQGVLLSEVLEPDYLAAHQLHGLGDLLAHLRTDCEMEGAAELARLMGVFARKDFGRVIFDNTLPALQPSAPAIVIRTHTLELPTREEIQTPHLFAQMKLEKIFGRALYTSIAGLARQICFADRSRLGVFAIDEAHHLTSSPEGELEVRDFVRDGRKHAAAVILGSHDPLADFGSETLRGLIPTRIQMRQRDKNLARNGLAWLDMDPNDDELLDLLITGTSPVTANGVEEHRRGEAFMRDSSGSIGRIKVLLPALEARNRAARTTTSASAPSTSSAPTTGGASA